MKFALDEDQQAFQDLARKFLADRASSERTRAAMDSEQGWDPAVWTELVEEQGWTALSIPEDYGGFGFGQVATAVMMEESGRRLLCAPLFSTVCLGTSALLTAASEEQKQRWLPAVAGGELRATLAWSGGEVAPVTAADGALTGQVGHVIDGASADLLIVPARGADGVLALYAVRADAEGVSAAAAATLDTTRRRATLTLEGAAAERLPGDRAAIDRALDLARVGLAAEQLGGAEACMDMAVEYAKVREQFGRAIGSFQAIKHKCADMLLLVESARSAVWSAAWTADNDPGALSVAASVAQAYCSDAYFKCAAENIQIHGGIGFTWEHDAHFYFKRARASADLLGSARWHRERIAQHLNL